MAQTAWSATGIGDFGDAALLCLPGVMNAGGGKKAVLCAVGKELGENMVTDTMYEAMEAGGCSEARSILNAVLIFRTVYSFVDMANSAVNAKNLRDAYKDKDWTDWVKRTGGTRKNSDVPEYPKGVVQESGSNAIPDLSNKAVKHPMNDHMPVRYAKQLQYMSKEAAEQYLSYKTFFNPNWTDEQVRAALNFGYKEALNSGVTTGKYSFKYLGENVTVYLEEGIFKTGYGDYVYTYDELLKLLGDE